MADTPTSGLDATLPVVVPKKSNVVDVNLLQNMQNMIDERSGVNPQQLIFSGPSYNTVMNSLKDVAAWASGGEKGPSAALAARDREKALEAKELFDMRTQVAAAKAAQEKQKRAMEFLGVGAMPGAAAAPGGAQTSAAPIAQSRFEQMLIGLPPASQNLARLAIGEGDIDTFKSIVQEGLKNRPDLQKNYEYAQTLSPEQQDVYLASVLEKGRAPQTVVGPTGEKYSVTLPGAMPRGVPGLPGSAPAAAPSAPAAAPSAGITNYGNIRPEGKSTGFQTYATPEEGLAAIDKNLQAYGKKGINTLEGVISRWAPPNENDTPTLIANAAKRLGINPSQPLDMGNPAVRQALGTAIMLQEHGNKIFAGAPGAAPTTGQIATPPTRKSEEQIAAEKAGDIRRREKMAEADVDTTKAIIDIGRNAGEKSVRLADASRIVNDESMKPMFGVLERGGVLGPITKFVAGGIQMGTLGSLKFGEMEGALRNAGATETQIANVHRIEQVLKQQELEYAKTYLKGQGAVSDNERNIVQQAIGSIKQPAEQLRLMINVMQERAAFDAKMYKEFNDYRKAIKDPYASFEKFTVDSPAADRLIAEHNQGLARILKVDAGGFSDPFNKDIAARQDKKTGSGVVYRKVGE